MYSCPSIHTFFFSCTAAESGIIHHPSTLSTLVVKFHILWPLNYHLDLNLRSSPGNNRSGYSEKSVVEWIRNAIRVPLTQHPRESSNQRRIARSRMAPTRRGIICGHEANLSPSLFIDHKAHIPKRENLSTPTGSNTDPSKICGSCEPGDQCI